MKRTSNSLHFVIEQERFTTQLREYVANFRKFQRSYARYKIYSADQVTMAKIFYADQPIPQFMSMRNVLRVMSE